MNDDGTELHVFTEDADLSLDRIVESIQSASDLFAAPPLIWVGTVKALGGRHETDQWITLATVLKIGFQTVQDRPEVLRFRDLVLASRTLDAAKLRDANHLLSLLTEWPTIPPTPDAALLRASPRVNRVSGRAYDFGFPAYLVNLSESRKGSTASTAAKGPYYHPQSGFFAEKPDEAAELWLGVPGIADSAHNENRCWILFADRRAHFTAVSLDTNVLTASVENRIPQPLYCCGSVADFRGRETSVRIEVRAGEPIVFKGERDISSFSLYLIDGRGGWFDQASNSPLWGMHRKKRDENAGTGVTHDSIPDDSTFYDDVQLGENQNVEFKAFLPLEPQRDKAIELPKSIVALANTGGGRLYIGVNDAGEIVGVEVSLLRELQKKLQTTDTEALIDCYVGELRKQISVGVTPQLSFDIGLLRWSNCTVICVAVRETKGKLHAVAANNSMYIRRGGTSRQVGPADLEPFFRQRGSTGRVRGSVLGGLHP